jgi:hypothetical protein
MWPERRDANALHNSHFSRTAYYRSIQAGSTRYNGLNSSSVNRCVSLVPLTRLLVTMIVSSGDSFVYATFPLQATSILKMIKPYTTYMTIQW